MSYGFDSENDFDDIEPFQPDDEDQAAAYERLMEELENEARWQAEQDQADMLLADALMPVLPDDGESVPF